MQQKPNQQAHKTPNTSKNLQTLTSIIEKLTQ